MSFYLSFAIILHLQSVDSRKEKDGILTDLNLENRTEFNDFPVRFAKSINVEFGATLNLADVKIEPEVQLDGLSGSGFTTLAMVDPDAPSRSNPVAKEWLHWLVVDIPSGQDIKNGIEKMKFAPSGPPRGSGKHRYIFLLFSHDTPISQNPNSNINERRGFKISRYAADNGLGQPKALNFYYTENA